MSSPSGIFKIYWTNDQSRSHKQTQFKSVELLRFLSTNVCEIQEECATNDEHKINSQIFQIQTSLLMFFVWRANEFAEFKSTHTISLSTKEC